MKTLSVYIHIPFCVHKCNYCDFLSAPATEAARKQYVEALKREIMQESLQYKEYSVDTVFFGGGTPSILKGEEIAECMETLRQYYQVSPDAEVTLEMNPGTADRNKLQILKKAGINRLSLGLQSTEDSLLRILGRIHTYEEFLQVYQDARELGFDNINIDLMSSLHGQSIQDWEKTLKKVLALEPEHISAYSLILEEGTPMGDHPDRYPPIPEEEADRCMYHLTRELMAQNGYDRYEISNYAKNGRLCRHNAVYWTRGNYVGFGLGASSMVENCRWKNTENMEQYLQFNSQEQSVKEDCHELDIKECMEEFMFLGLRMMQGVSVSEFQILYGHTIEEVYGSVLNKWQNTGYLIRQNGYIRLTEKGIDVSNVIMADFLLD